MQRNTSQRIATLTTKVEDLEEELKKKQHDLFLKSMEMDKLKQEGEDKIAQMQKKIEDQELKYETTLSSQERESSAQIALLREEAMQYKERIEELERGKEAL